MPSQILKPCKCGGEPFFVVERISSFGEITAWSVRCRNVSCPCYLYGHWWPTQEAAINDWNRRMEKGNETSPRLSRCARLLRRCRRSSRIGTIHPCRHFAYRLLFIPLFIVLLALYYVGKFGTWLSNLESWTEGFAGTWRDWVESPREIDLHRRVWKRARKE